MDRSIVVWIGTIVVVLVFLDLLFVELRRVFREGKRLANRLAAYAELPIISRLATGERDVERILAAVGALAVLMERAQRAIAVLRRYLPKGSSPG
jgi:hypothetical protein